jgi:hypothetical protein
MVVVPKLDLTKKVMSSYSIFYVLGEAAHRPAAEGRRMPPSSLPGSEALTAGVVVQGRSTCT